VGISTKVTSIAEKYISGGLPPAREGPTAQLWEVPEEIYFSAMRSVLHRILFSWMIFYGNFLYL